MRQATVVKEKVYADVPVETSKRKGRSLKNPRTSSPLARGWRAPEGAGEGARFPRGHRPRSGAKGEGNTS